jgi:excisionase family DNA binding protein
MEIDEIVDVSAAAKSLNIKPGTLRLWISQRRVGVIRLGARLLKIPRSEVERLKREGYVPPASPMPVAGLHGGRMSRVPAPITNN